LALFGLANYVFPGALQNRFNHSIGVLHYADEMVCSLQKKGFLEGVRKRVHMAALLHDIGHYPLSHITERVVLKDAKSIPPPSKLIVTEQESISEEIFDHPLHKLS
jgi:HD superfamily phosphohydrolase